MIDDNQFSNFASRNSQRITQQNLTPAAVTGSNLSSAINATSAVTQQFTLLPVGSVDGLGNPTDSAIVRIVTSSNKAPFIGAEIYFSFYLNSISSLNQVPFGKNVTPANFQYAPASYDWNNWTGKLNETAWVAYVRNLTAGSITMWLALQVKYLGTGGA